MEKEYAVVVKAGVDLELFDAELLATTGAGPVPNRSVAIANPRLGSKRMTHWMLTDEEVTELNQDDRVLSIEIPIDQRNDIQIGLHKTQSDKLFTRSSGINETWANWGLRRCIEQTNVYNNSSAAPDNNFDYAVDGSGVDVVIQDSGIQVDHPEFMIAGTSRVQQIDWYTASGLPGTQSVNHYRDWDGHGTHVAGTVAGKTHGWAKGARIYSQKLNGLEFDGNTGISIIDAFDTIRLWHNAKPIDPATGFKRPTVVNMSWGYSTTRSGDPDSGTYRGVDWNYDIDYTTRSGLWAGVGYTEDFINGGTQQRVPVRVPSVDAEIEDMISQGIHVCIAAGNNLYKAELLGGVDYNNTVTFGATTTNYHRGSSPYSDNAFMVGNLDTATFNDGGIFRDKTAFSSTRGPGVNIWSPGTNIVSACSTINQFGSSPIPSPEDSNFKILSISGTSMAAPQVAGVVAQHLQVRPDLTPAQMQDRINGDTLEVIYTTDSTTDYSTNESILGAANRHLYSRYGVANPVTMPLSALTFTGLRLKLD
tara:strand:+ start:1471 stop:3072 length:1602 start_codon:yes stop_codon:yes gene_type:complete